MRCARALSLLLLPATLTLSSCDKDASTETPSDAVAPAESSTPRSAPEGSRLTGLVDEDTFASMHQLSEAEAPALRGETVELAGTRAYLSLPEGASGPVPALVVIHEWWGLNDHIRHWTDRLAADGYAALAVDLYGGEVATTPDEAMAIMKRVDPEAAAATLQAAHAFLASDPRIQATRRGVIGWCFGGGWSLRHAIATSDLDAAVIYYGRTTEDPAELGQIQAPLLGVFANEDRSIPPEVVDGFAAALESAGKSIELHRYDAEHAFANPSNARYDHDSAADAWSRVRAFLARELREGE
ncbi:dienelactone hydrolase family protein [Plesiocystis pacifica SIR-1]|uniref:Dienelactone hydrolase family protein n=1 Tax=Plesiocystis pacifica SIR-1 TaxID=391625 RepID=A6G671_9BACT|nr:dienelactone hydrolase family protein [Plesiocystis pacifica]EDM78673.1 dienelactone hydrolase family protein [Plesiocystis pacifica SIR-1]